MTILTDERERKRSLFIDEFSTSVENYVEIRLFCIKSKAKIHTTGTKHQI